MQRLVERITNERNTFLTYVGKENPYEAPLTIGEMERAQITDVMSRLEDYEETGFSPLQVKGLFADKLNLLNQLETTKCAYETLKEHYDLATGKLESKQPLSTDYEDEMQCPSCREVVDESDSPIQCVSCKQVLDWSCI